MAIDVSGQPLGPYSRVKQEDSFTLEDGTDRLSQNLGDLTTNLGCVTSQKNEDLIRILFAKLCTMYYVRIKIG